MPDDLSRLKHQIGQIEALKKAENWGPEFQLWKSTTEKTVQHLFGVEGLKLFRQQATTTFSYLEKSFNDRQYLKELENRKKILEGLLSNLAVDLPLAVENQKADSSKDILKEIWKKEDALKENLLPTEEVRSLHESLIRHIESILPSNSLPGLRFKKMRTEQKITWWSTEGGYPIDNPWSKFQPFFDLLAQHEAEQTIKRRIESEGLFVESRAKGEDQHLLIGEKNGTAEKAHIIIDGKTGEIRVEDDQQEPTDLVARIETILTLNNGKKIKTTREVIEESE